MSSQSRKKKKTKKRGRDSSDSLKASHLWWNTMQLLGFNGEKRKQQRKEDERRTSMVFGEKMFNKSNPLGLLFVLHFLFHRLDKEQTDKDLTGIWPCNTPNDRQRCKTEFHKKLESLHQSKHLPSECVRKSILTTASGKPVYNLLWRLSTYVMRQELSTFPSSSSYQIPNFPAPQTLSQSELPKQSQMIKDLLIRTQKNFLSHSQLVEHSHAEWRGHARQQTEKILRLEEEEKALAKQHSELEPEIAELQKKDLFSEQKRVDEIWKKIDSINPNCIDGIDSREILSRKPGEIRISGSQLKSKLGQSSSSSHPVNIGQLCSQWNSSLENVRDAIIQSHETNDPTGHESFLNSLDEVNQSMKHHISHHKESLKIVENVNADLQESIPRIMENVSRLEKEIQSELFEDDFTEDEDLQLLSLQLLTDDLKVTVSDKKLQVSHAPEVTVEELAEKFEPPTFESLPEEKAKYYKYLINGIKESVEEESEKGERFPIHSSSISSSSNPSANYTPKFQNLSTDNQRQLRQPLKNNNQQHGPLASSLQHSCYDEMNDIEEEGLLSDQDMRKLMAGEDL